MAATAQREQAPRAGTLRRSLARAAPRVPLHVFEQPALDQAFAEAMARAQNDDARDGAIAADVETALDAKNALLAPPLLESHCPDRTLRIAFQSRRNWRDIGAVGVAASLLVHGGAIAAMLWLFHAAVELPPVSEEAIPIEFIVAGAVSESAETEQGARAETTIAPPDLPETPPIDIARELPQVDIQQPMEPPSVDVAADPPTVDVPPPPETPPVEIPTPLVAQLDLPPPPDAPLLADLTPPVLAVAPSTPSEDVVPPAHAIPKPVEKPVEPKPAQAAKPVAPKKVEPKKIEPKKIAAKPVQEKPVQRVPTAERQEPVKQAARGRGEAGQGESDQRRAASNRGGGAAAVANYRSQVLAHLARFKVYPEQARDRGVTGRAAVAFTLSRGGQVMSASLSASSGAAILDQATIAMVRRAAPFPAMPEGGPSSMSFNAGVNYNLR